MKQTGVIYLFLVGILLSGTRCKNDSNSHYYYDFQFLTENYKPFNYADSGKIAGLAPELLEKICDNLNIPFKVSVLPWDEAYSRSLAEPDCMLFSTSMNSKRKDLFKWAGPIASLEWYFYSLSKNSIKINSIDEARSIRAIGVLKDYTTEQYLVNLGFKNLYYFKDNQEAISKLLDGSIDLFPADRYTTEAIMQKLGKSFFTLKEVLPIKTELVYFAFNKAVPDAVVADFQREIDHLKENGELKSLSQKYLNTSYYPGIIQFYTEDYPPLTFMNKYGEASGYGAEVVKEIMKRNRIFADIRISDWSNGYELALNNPNFCLFTMDRTTLRESLFNWIGPIGSNSTYIYLKSGTTLKINNLEDAKKLNSIGTVSSWYSDQYLRNQGFTNLISDKDPSAMAINLMTGKIDAFVCSEVTFPDILKAAGYQYNNVTPAFAVMSSDYYIAFSKNTTPAIVTQWQATFNALKNDGTLAAIRSRWLP